MQLRRAVASVAAGALVCGALVVAACGGDGETVTNTVEVCPASMTDCGGTCVDTTSNPTHCGACDNGCGTGEYCAAGTCTTTGGGCPSPLSDCSGACVDTSNDPAHCGGCDSPCGTGEHCTSGTCTGAGCPSPFIDCSGTCTDINTDSEHCGGCTTTCDPGEKCNGAGVCDLTCQDGFIDCGGTCIDPNTNDTYCGASGDCLTTNAGTTCGDGEKCNGAGVCALSCQSGLIECGSTCIDPTSNETYCGATGDCLNANAGTSCSNGQICSGSACVPTCSAGLVLCGQSCIDPDFDPAHCGVTAQCTGGDICTNSEFCDLGTCTATSSGGGTSCATTTATTSMPAQTSTITSTRGYWFTALSDFIITGVNVPTLTGNQSIQVMRFNSGPPPNFSASTTDYTNLAYIKSNPSPSWINVCIPVFTGDHIGIFGQRNTTTSYGAPGPTVTINGNGTVITRLLYQGGSISTAPAGAVSSEPGGSIGRIELQTAPM